MQKQRWGYLRLFLSLNHKTSPQDKCHKPSILFTSLTISTSLDFIIRFVSFQQINSITRYLVHSCNKGLFCPMKSAQIEHLTEAILYCWRFGLTKWVRISKLLQRPIL